MTPLTLANNLEPFAGVFKPISKIASETFAFFAFCPSNKPVKYALDKLLVLPFQPSFVKSFEHAAANTLSPSGLYSIICMIVDLRDFLTTNLGFELSKSFNRFL